MADSREQSLGKIRAIANGIISGDYDHEDIDKIIRTIAKLIGDLAEVLETKDKP